MASLKEWYRDEFLISTSPKLLQPSVINAAFDSGQLYWTKGMSEDELKKVLSNSLCFGVYALPKTSSELAGKVYPTHLISTENLRLTENGRSKKYCADWVGTAHHR